MLLRGALTDLHLADLLSVLLGPGGVPRAQPCARDLLDRFGGLAPLSAAAAEELLACEHLGPAGTTRLLACFELGRRQSRASLLARPQIGSPADVAELLGPTMAGLRQEQFRVLLLDSKHRVRKDVIVALGGLNAAVVHPRDVLRPAILSSAAAMVLAHNHPSGDPEPSEEDLRLTARFHEACRLMGIDLLDHVIIGDGGFTSIKERGLIP